eukprot:6200720-Pleurochrysis_carterae.AAC.1
MRRRRSHRIDDLVSARVARAPYGAFTLSCVFFTGGVQHVQTALCGQYARCAWSPASIWASLEAKQSAWEVFQDGISLEVGGVVDTVATVDDMDVSAKHENFS